MFCFKHPPTINFSLILCTWLLAARQDWNTEHSSSNLSVPMWWVLKHSKTMARNCGIMWYNFIVFCCLVCIYFFSKLTFKSLTSLPVGRHLMARLYSECLQGILMQIPESPKRRQCTLNPQFHPTGSKIGRFWRCFISKTIAAAATRKAPIWRSQKILSCGGAKHWTSMTGTSCSSSPTAPSES